MLDSNYFEQVRKRKRRMKTIGFIIIATAIVGSLYLRYNGYRLYAPGRYRAWKFYNVK